MNKPIKIGGHRGCWKTKGEQNTIYSMEKALEIGMDYVEIDMQYTKDNIIVIIHDDEVLLDGKNQCVVDLTYKQLISVNENIPTLREVLKRFNGTNLGFLLEVKSCVNKLNDRVYDYMQALLNELKEKENICVFSIDYVFLRLFNEIDEDDNITKGIIVTESLHDPVGFMQYHNVKLYLAMLQNLNKGIVNALKKEGYLVSGSVVNTLQDKKMAKKLRVDMFETDCYSELK